MKCGNGWSRKAAPLAIAGVALLAVHGPAEATPPVGSEGALVVPAANARGWNNTPVTITFPCGEAGRSSCHGPARIDVDGANQTLDVTTRDQSARERQVRITVSVDVTAPVVSISAPADGFKTTDDKITVSGRVSDGTSGLLWAACNGRRVVLADGIVRCTVSLSPGLNTVFVHAMDVAGNSGSAGVRVFRESAARELAVIPQEVTIGRGGLRSDVSLLRAHAESGSPVTTVQWSTSDPTVVSLETDQGWAIVRSRAPGRATVFAKSAGRTASATVTVAEDVEGSVLWSVPVLPGQSTHRPIHVQRRTDLGGDVILTSEASPGRALVRSIGRSSGGGFVVWRGEVEGTPWFADAQGGFVARLGSGAQASHAVGRFDGPGAGRVWRYDSENEIVDGFPSGDNLIYFIEHVSSRDGGHDVAVAIDGDKGVATSRFMLPTSTTRTYSCDGRVTSRQEPSQRGAPLGIDNGLVMTVVESHTEYHPYCEAGRRIPGRGRLLVSRALRLVRTSPESTDAISTLWTRDADGPDTDEWLRTLDDVEPGPLLPTMLRGAEGDVVVVWQYVRQDAGTPLVDAHVTRIGEASSKDFVLEGHPALWQLQFDLYDGPWVFASNGTVVRAINLVNGETRWSKESAALPFLPIGDVGLLMHDVVNGAFVELDNHGQVVSRVSARIAGPLVIVHNSGVMNGLDPETQAFVEVAVPGYLEAGVTASVNMDDAVPGSSQRRQALAALIK